MPSLIPLFVLLLTLGLLYLLHAMRSAPDGYEDETGFQLVKPTGVVPVRLRSRMEQSRPGRTLFYER